MSKIIIPVELTKEALRYVEERSRLIWNSGDSPTGFMPASDDDYKYLSLANCGGRMCYGMVREFDDGLYEFNELDLFIKGYERIRNYVRHNNAS